MLKSREIDTSIKKQWEELTEMDSLINLVVPISCALDKYYGVFSSTYQN